MIDSDPPGNFEWNTVLSSISYILRNLGWDELGLMKSHFCHAVIFTIVFDGGRGKGTVFF